MTKQQDNLRLDLRKSSELAQDLYVSIVTGMRQILRYVGQVTLPAGQIERPTDIEIDLERPANPPHSRRWVKVLEIDVLVIPKLRWLGLAGSSPPRARGPVVAPFTPIPLLPSTYFHRRVVARLKKVTVDHLTIGKNTKQLFRVSNSNQNTVDAKILFFIMTRQNSRVERLTPLDLIMPRGYVRTLFTFRTTQPISSVTQSLQSGLNELVRQVPWLSGRVVPATTSTSETAVPRLEIRWGGEDDPAAPVLLDKGTVTESYDTLSARGMPPADLPADVWPVSGGFDEAVFAQGSPVLAASIFRFSDGQGIGLCICAHHSAVDGTAFGEIVRLWARNTMGSGSGLPPPLSDRDRLDRLSQTLSSHLAVTSACSIDDLYASHPELSRTPPTFPETGFPPSTSTLFEISLAQVDALKAQLLKSRDNAQSAAGPPFSTNTVVCALLWSAITRARAQRDKDLAGQASRLLMAVNCRQRMGDASFSPPEDPYLGNAVLCSLTDLPVKCLQSASFSSALDRPHGEEGSPREICDAIARFQSSAQIDARFVAEVCSLVDGVGDYRTVFPSLDVFGSRDFSITSWANLDLYDMEFGAGLGKPETIRLPHIGADGVAIILPRKRAGACNVANGPGVIEVIIMLRNDDMETLARDDQWKAFLAKPKNSNLD